MANAFSDRLGVTAEERVANMLSLGSNVSVRNIGLMVERDRGVENKPILVTSLREDKAIFGGHNPNRFSSYVVENLFVNSNGYPVNLYQVRLVGTGSTAAKGDIMSNDGVPVKILTVEAGRLGEKDKGTWGNSLSVVLYPKDNKLGSTLGHMLVVKYNGVVVESFVADGTSFTSLAEKVNGSSEYICITIADATKTITAVQTVALTGGTYVAPQASDYTPSTDVSNNAVGMQIFAGVDVQIFCAPDCVISTVLSKACEQLARDTGKFYLFNLPYLANEAAVISYKQALDTAEQSFCASILNWVQVAKDTVGNKIWIPALGYALGAGYIRKCGLNNGFVWTPPAGVETAARGVFAITHDKLDDATLSRYGRKWTTNVIKYIGSVGFCLWNSRTYSNNELFQSIHIRLETNWLLPTLMQRLEKFGSKIITPTMLKSMNSDIKVFMKNIYEQGGIEQSVDFSDAVVIDISVNPANRKEVEIYLGWIPPECLEHIHLKLTRNDGILTLNQ